jgi:peptidoglycan-N-acetylglucosamine deacetylase
MHKPIASLSCDMDNKWAYMKAQGDPAWESLPSYLETVVPRLLALLKGHGLQATFFLVGQDAVLENNRALFRSIAMAGHEIGNHTFHHDPWLHLYSKKEIADDIARAEDQIEQATGQRPVGFRGPGYTLSWETVTELARRGYLYDSTTLPTFIGPLGRAYYFMSSKLTRDDLERRKNMFGVIRDGFRPIRPYKWDVDGKSLMEIPVTTMPFLRVPIHISYVLYLSLYSQTFAEGYFRIALAMCRVAGVEPSILLHPLDILDMDEASGMSFFPGMSLPLERKLGLVSRCLERLKETFHVVTIREHAMRAAHEAGLPLMSPVP